MIIGYIVQEKEIIIIIIILIISSRKLTRIAQVAHTITSRQVASHWRNAAAIAGGGAGLVQDFAPDSHRFQRLRVLLSQITSLALKNKDLVFHF